jgi:hypothetical protein
VIITALVGGWIGAGYRSDFILPLGRGAHFMRGIFAIFTGVMIATGCIGMATLLFILLPVFSPPAKDAYSLSSVRWMWPFYPLMLSPLFGGVMILLRMKHLSGGLTLGLVVIISILGSGFWIIGIVDKPVTSGLLMILLISFIAWSFHISALYHDTMKRSLC